MLSLAQTIKDLKNNIVNILNTMAPKTYVDKKVADLVNGAPAQLDTLQELSKALNNDKDFGATVNNAIAKKLDSAGGTITGNLTVKGTLTAKASTAGTADRALKADTCTGNAATASSVSWSGITNKPTSFTPTIAAEVAGTAPAAGQIVRVNSLGALITNDLLKTVRAAGTDADISKLVAEPISMKEMFSNWQRISCAANGQNQNSNSSDQTTARACYYYDDNTRTIVCPNNSDPFSAFVSSDSYAPDYRIKYQLTGRDGDDDGLCFIAGFMVDKAGKFHTLTVWRMGDNETQAPDPISDYKASSHQARFAICYDVYAAWMPQSPNGIVLARTVAPLKTDWYTKTCLCEVQKTSTQIIAKTADVNSTDMKYTLTFTLPSSKPADWPQEAYDNIKFMMQNSSQIGFGTQSNPCSFKILEQTGSITAITVYNVNTGKKLTYMNGAKQSEVDDSNVLTPGCFLYSTITKKLFYVKNKDMVVLIDNGGEDILTNKNVVKNGTPTKDVSLRYETENGKNVVIPYVDGVKVPLSANTWDSITGKPSTFAPSSHSHGWGEISNKPAQATRWPTWGEVSEKPTSFTPAAHSHGWDSITGKPSTFAPSGHSHAWDSITGKPSTFTPSSHNHAWSNITGAPATATRWPTWDEITGKPATFPSSGGGVASSVAWNNITGKPSTFAPSSHGHAWGEISGAPAQATRWPTWSEVSSKPGRIVTVASWDASTGVLKLKTV